MGVRYSREETEAAELRRKRRVRVSPTL